MQYLVIAGILCVSAAPLYSFTVVVVTNHSTNQENIRTAIEDGIMSEFFNSGHIVLNANPNTINYDYAHNYQWLRNIAFDMGGEYLLWVESSHSIHNKLLTLTTNAKFIELARPGTLVESSISEENSIHRRNTPEHLSRLRGQRIIKEILTKIDK